MELNIDVTDKEFAVTKNPEPKVDQTGTQRFDKQAKLPMWATQVVVTDTTGGEVLSITTAGENPPDVERGDLVDVFDLVAMPWNGNGRSGVSFRAASIQVVPD